MFALLVLPAYNQFPCIKALANTTPKYELASEFMHKTFES